MRQWRDVDVAERFDIRRLAGLGANGRGEPGLEVRRPDDLLLFSLRLRNLELDTTGPSPRLVGSAEGQPSLLLIAPQSFGEQAFHIDSATEEPVPHPLPSARIRISGPSRVALTMPQAETELPDTFAGCWRPCGRGRRASTAIRFRTPILHRASFDHRDPGG